MQEEWPDSLHDLFNENDWVMLRCWHQDGRGRRHICPECWTVVKRNSLRASAGRCKAHGTERAKGHPQVHKLLRELGHVGPIFQEMPVHTLRKVMGRRASRRDTGEFQSGCRLKVDMLALSFGAFDALAIEVCGDDHLRQEQRERDARKAELCHWPVCWLFTRHKLCRWREWLAMARDGRGLPSLNEATP